MALLPILTAPDPRLKKKSKPVETVDAEVRQLMDDMLETMYAAPGIGLAAPQVGELKRVIVLDIDREDVKTGPLLHGQSRDHRGLRRGRDLRGRLPVGARALFRRGAAGQGARCAISTATASSRKWPARACWRPACSTRSTISTASCSSTTSPSLKRNMILRKLLKARKEKERDEAEGKPAAKPR